MFKKKITKKSLEELAKIMPVIEEWEMRTMIGGGTGVLIGSYENPYSMAVFESMLDSGTWITGAYVEGLGFVGAEATITGSFPSNGYWGSHYIGPTSDLTMSVMPTPKNVADYIAMQHDLDYQRLGLNGFSGMVSPESRRADQKLIQRCNELIDVYESGGSSYCGYAVTKEVYEMARKMKAVFVVEQGITGIFQ